MGEVVGFSADIISANFTKGKPEGILSHLEKGRESVHCIIQDNIVYQRLKSFFESDLPRNNGIERITSEVQNQLSLCSNTSEKLIFIGHLQQSVINLIQSSIKSPLSISSINELISCLGHDIYNKSKINFCTKDFLQEVSLAFENTIRRYMETEDEYIIDKYIHCISAYMSILNMNRRIRYFLPYENIEEYLEGEYINLSYTFLDQAEYQNISRLFNSTPGFRSRLKLDDIKEFLSELYDKFLSYQCKISSKHIYSAITTASKNFAHKDKQYFEQLMNDTNDAYKNMPKELTLTSRAATILHFPQANSLSSS